ncbi:MAG: hypothetical protein N2316_11800 [Spirochaetes bacterium]|nr:hypothetical protein [Spirochaetota bacterium]
MIMIFSKNAESALQPKETYEKSNGPEISQDREIKKMMTSVRDLTLPSEQARYRPLTSVILDQWLLGHDLDIAISELEENYVWFAS